MSDPLSNIPEIVDSNPYAPQEPPDLVFLEKIVFAGLHLSGMLYGISALLFFRCTVALLSPKRGQSQRFILATYTFLLFALGTVFIAMSIHIAQLAFIDNRNFPGGPNAYVESQHSSALVVIPSAAFVLSNWLADGLLLLRCRTIWVSNPWIMIFPGVMYLTSIAMGVMTMFQSSQPNANLWTTVTVHFALPYFSVSTALNVVLTLLICVRLVFHQRRLNRNFGPSARLLPYNGIVAMLIESSALYAISSLLFIGTYGANNNTSVMFLHILSQTQIIAPLLIISRVARQRAWTSTSATQPVTLVGRLDPNNGTTTQVDSIPLEIRSGYTKKGNFNMAPEGDITQVDSIPLEIRSGYTIKGNFNMEPEAGDV